MKGENFNQDGNFNKNWRRQQRKPWSSEYQYKQGQQKREDVSSPNRNEEEAVKAAAELLSRRMAFLTADLCEACKGLLQDRFDQLAQGNIGQQEEQEKHPSPSPSSGATEREGEGIYSSSCISAGTSWADLVQQEEEDEIESEERRREEQEQEEPPKRVLSRDEREYIRFMAVGRKKDFMCFERVNGKLVNVVQGLELHTGVFSAAEQNRIVDFIYQVQEQGRKKQLRERTYSEPRKWMRGKGRITIQFGCCYNYAVDKSGNPPGIIRNEDVDPIPPLFKTAIRRLVRWHVLPPSCVPDSCIVNIYEEGDCIPPHIDHHDFDRPFCTISFLSECNIIFGTNLKILAPGEFAGPIAIPLPLGSVLVLNGNGADVAKHSVPAVPHRRISITFRKMDQSKLPYNFVPEPDLQGIEPLSYMKDNRHSQSEQSSHPSADGEIILNGESVLPAAPSFSADSTDFPPLSGSHSANRQHGKSKFSRNRFLN
uniref:Fe2OG dioxygenase domain-containing protein n=1 Tax=Araucaria cunninghamii TaxID=56994 RepID=A0A0D6QUJ5_ARACU